MKCGNTGSEAGLRSTERARSSRDTGTGARDLSAAPNADTRGVSNVLRQEALEVQAHRRCRRHRLRQHHHKQVVRGSKPRRHADHRLEDVQTRQHSKGRHRSLQGLGALRTDTHQEKGQGNEMDHCNPGGFAAIFEAWVKDKDMNELYSNVVHNDPRKKSTGRQGSRPFRSPY